MIINMIAGVDNLTNGIGYKGSIPWKNKEDMNWFKKHTLNNAVIMGWSTFVSLGKPLKNRFNIVISHTHDAESLYNDNVNVKTARSIEESIEIAKNAKYEMAYVIGGESIYKQFLIKDLVDTIYIDYIQNDEKYEYDAKFPFECINSHYDYVTDVLLDSTVLNYNKNTFIAFHKDKIDENINIDDQYINLLKDIMRDGTKKETRAGATRSLFGKQLSFDMSYGLPVLTTKKMFLKGCIHELLWFLSGSTNIKYLVDNNVHIWDDDAYRWYVTIMNDYNTTLKADVKIDSKEEFIAKIKESGDEYYICMQNGKPDYHYGDLGPVYGKQWRNWGDYVDQIARLINTLKNNPDDRRMLVSAWNVDELNEMALPPCHYSFQIYTKMITLDERYKIYMERQETSSNVTKMPLNEDLKDLLDEAGIPERKISLMWNQRSVDTCLGLPYNITSYAILLEMIAQVVNMIPDKLICSLGDTHIYENQIYQALMQTNRNPYLFKCPKLKLNKEVKNINDFKYEDIKIVDYESYPTLKYELSVGSPK